MLLLLAELAPHRAWNLVIQQTMAEPNKFLRAKLWEVVTRNKGKRYFN